MPDFSDPQELKDFLTRKRHAFLRHLHRNKGRGFSRLEYLEMKAEEMRKFKNLPLITSSDIENVNWDELLSQLVA